MLLFIFKAVILLKISFLIAHSEKKVKITFNSWTTSHPYPHYIFTKRFLMLFYIKYTSFFYQFGVCSGISVGKLLPWKNFN